MTDLIVRSVAARSFDPDSRTCEAVIATPAPYGRRDARGPYLEVLDTEAIDPASLVGLPVLDSHRDQSVRDTIGTVVEARREGEALVAKLQLTGADDVRPILQRIEDGTLRGVSIGYRVSKWQEQNGSKARTKVAVEWAITEVTLTTNPADKAATIRSKEEVKMLDHDNPAVTAEEKQRRADIRALTRQAGLSAEVADDLIDAGADMTAAKAAVFDAVSAKRSTAPIIRPHAPANDDPAVVQRRASDALAYRMAGGDLPDDAKPYLNLSLKEMAADALARAGVATRGMSADEIFTRAGMHTTSDFPLLVSNAVGKVAMQAYQVAESPLKKLARKKTLRDFKPASSIWLGELGRLERITEAGEITHTTITEGGETMKLATYARAINLSRELLINDDVHMLGDLTAAFGRAAAQTEADILVNLLTSNPAMADGDPVFDADRGNIGTPGALSIITLSAARLAMRKRTGRDGTNYINVTPKYLVMSPELETDAEQLLAQIAAATVGDVNPWTGKLTPLVDPRLPEGTFYLFADPAVAPALQYAYLAGAEGVQVQRREMWDQLGVGYRAWLDFGAGWLDWRGVQRVSVA
ncbi:prohead protease/major capsid protein fusion protein [Paracoccus yeei]|uniref:prohead protease/major capsid protein fusion protein n=1 Tax=Paracoccus yeei TaxID=147645 RepID=UPI001749789C|nr:prohead protease/major capsid protein fusion protein [Paracoccus yeei]